MDAKIRVKFIGGRQIVGVLKGFDQLMNLVLQEVEETLRGMYTDQNEPGTLLTPFRSRRRECFNQKHQKL